jgi:MinD-like ATPase involved in chromosome partitioning or flagellar assembly
MIVTLEEVKKNLLENIEKYFSKETIIYNNIKKLLIIRDSLGKINFAFFSSAENPIQLAEIKKIISGWFQQSEMPLERFDEWLGECFIDDLEIDDLFHGAGEEITNLNKVYWHEEALHLEDWKVLQKKLSQNNEVRKDRNAKVISFYSYKGGVGRTTLCAITALELSQRNQKVVVIDTDIEAPSLAFQFFGKGGRASYYCSGFLDFLLYPYEQLSPEQQERFNLFLLGEFFIQNRSDYPNIYLMPVAKFQNTSTNSFDAKDYEQKLSRVNYLQGTAEKVELLLQLLETTIAPDYVIFDLRTGITDIGGILANFSDFYCFVGYPDSQNRLGLSFFVEHALKTKQIDEYTAFSNTIFVHSPAPVDEKKVLLASEYDAFIKMVRDLLAVSHLNQAVIENEEIIKDEEEFLLVVPYQSNLGVLIRDNGIKEVYKSGQLEYVEYYNKIAERIFLALEGKSPVAKTKSSIKPNFEKIFEEYRSQNLPLTSDAADAETDLNDAQKMVDNFQPLRDYKEIFKDEVFLIIGEKGAGKSALEQVFDHSKNQTGVVNFLIKKFDINWEIKNPPIWLTATDKPLVMELTKEIHNNPSLKEPIKTSLFWEIYSFALIKFYLENKQPITVDTRKNIFNTIISEYNHHGQLIADEKINQKNLHNEMVSQHQHIVLTYDYLDMLESDQNTIFLESIEELVKMWYFLKLTPGFSAINAKIFLRDDLFGQFKFTDKGKIKGNHAYTINWDFNKLMAVLFKRLCTRSDSLFRYIKETLAKQNILLQTDEETKMIMFPEKPEATVITLPLLFGERITQSSSLAFLERYLWNGKITQNRKQYNVRFMLQLMNRVLKACQPLPPEKAGVFDIYTTMKTLYCQIATDWVNHEIFVMHPELRPLIEKIKDKARSEVIKFKSGRIKATHLRQYLQQVMSTTLEETEQVEYLRQLESIGFIQKFKYDYDEFDKLEFYFPELFRAYLGIRKVNSLPPCQS